MKYILTLCLLIPIVTFSQSIDEIVYKISDSVSSYKTDSLSNSLDSSITYTLFTKDAVPINVTQLTVVRNSLYAYKVVILAINTANGDGANGEYNYAIKNISGNYSFVRNAAVMPMYYQGTLANAKYSISNNGTITITGIKNLIIKWTVKIEEISHVTVP